MQKKVIFLIIILCTSVLILVNNSFSFVIKKKGKTYLVDRRGEQWDITQAVSLGFNPEKFQYGLGRTAFTPLDDHYSSSDTSNVSPNLRILAIADNFDARAYSIPKLGGHEIANSMLGSSPIAVAY